MDSVDKICVCIKDAMQQSVYRKHIGVMLLTAGLISGCASIFSGTSQRSTEIRDHRAPNHATPYNRPYKVRGVTYYPMRSAAGYRETGHASWYGSESGNRTAMGTRFLPQGLTAAHKTLPLPSRVRVTNLQNGRHVDVVVNDRGPFKKGRIIDLSHGAAKRIGLHGVARVRVEHLGDKISQK
jgi:rare lipoprotein A